MKDAVVVLGSDGTYEDATPSALQLLGVTLEVRASPPNRFRPEPADPAEQAAFREEWERQGSPGLAGKATMRRADGSLARISFTIGQAPGGRFHALLRPIAEPVEQAARVYTLGTVLAEWRAAERQLHSIPVGSPQYEAVRSAIESYRTDYQRLFAEERSRQGS